jgi:hypothetical protein
MAAAASVVAQGVTPTPTPVTQAVDAASIIFAPRPPSPEPTPHLGIADRPDSTAIAADIASTMPVYGPELYSPKSGTSAADLRDIDKPKNQIPRLPVVMMQKYVVRESQLPEFRTRDLYTKAGLIELSFKEHPGLRIGNFFNLNAKVAYDMMVDEQLYAARQDLVDTVFAMAAGGDPQEIDVMQQAILDSAFIRESPVGK